MRACWRTTGPRYQGEFFSFDGIGVVPQPPRKATSRSWIGGHTPRALRRVVELGDGWHAAFTPPDALEADIARLREECARRNREFDGARHHAPRAACPSATRPAAPTASRCRARRDQIVADLRRFRELGVGSLLLEARYRDLDDMVAIFERFAREIRPAVDADPGGPSMPTTDATIETESTELLRTLIRNACVNTGEESSGGESRSCDALESYFAGSGLACERYTSSPGRMSLITRIQGSDPKAPTVLLMGHTDVVPVSPSGWKRDPFAAELVDGVVWGRGAIDMLNLTSTMAVATRRLRTTGWRPRGTLIYLAVADEEAGGVYGAEHLVEHEFDAVKCDYVVTESGGVPIPTPSGTSCACR